MKSIFELFIKQNIEFKFVLFSIVQTLNIIVLLGAEMLLRQISKVPKYPYAKLFMYQEIWSVLKSRQCEIVHLLEHPQGQKVHLPKCLFCLNVNAKMCLA